MPPTTDARKGQGPGQLSKTEFAARFRERFLCPAFDAHQSAIEELIDVAWDGYKNSRKSPRTRKAGTSYADPGYDLSLEWLAAKDAVEQAQREYEDPRRPSRILLICGSARNDKTCPGEISKSFRMMQVAKTVFEECGVTVDALDLSLLTSEF